MNYIILAAVFDSCASWNLLPKYQNYCLNGKPYHTATKMEHCCMDELWLKDDKDIYQQDI